MTPAARGGDPLHGVTLERVLTELVDYYGWERMARRVRINCFTSDPSIASSLKFLRRTPWAREKVEAMYVDMQRQLARRRARERPAEGDAAEAADTPYADDADAADGR